MSFRGRISLGLLAAFAMVVPLVATSESAAADVVGRATVHTPQTTSTGQPAATSGQTMTFTGAVPGGARRVNVWRIWNRQLVSPVGVTSARNGSFSIAHRMNAMPIEYYQVVAPAANGQPRWVSQKITVTNEIRDLDLWRKQRTNDFIAWITNATMNIDGSHRTARAGHGVPGRPIALQRRNADGTWTTFLGPKTSDANGQVIFTFNPDPKGVYRALALQYQGITPYPSYPVWMSPPALTARAVADPSGKAVPAPGPDATNGAAAVWRWRPHSLEWDTEMGEGLNVQGCTGGVAYCTPWSEFSDGSGRINITDGGIALDSGNLYPAPPATEKSPVVWGNMSSTLRVVGSAFGRWEMRANQAEWVAGRTPYITRVSLVPKGTPDSVVNPPKRIVLAQWRGYNPNTTVQLAQGVGKPMLSRTIRGVQYAKANWHDFAVQVNPTRIVWFIDGKPIGEAGGAATKGTVWVPRIQAIATPGFQMDNARSTLDWVLFYPLAGHRDARLVPPQPRLAAVR